jgi:hypothetical protein
MSVIVRGLDARNPERQDTVFEPRLLEAVRGALGQQIHALRHAPWDPSESDDPWTGVGVPVTPFPRWVWRPRCYRLGPLDPLGQPARILGGVSAVSRKYVVAEDARVELLLQAYQLAIRQTSVAADALLSPAGPPADDWSCRRAAGK